MHVRREARLVDDHRYGVELSLAPTPVKSSQKNRPDAPYEGLPPNRWMPGTNAKCPLTPGVGQGKGLDLARPSLARPASPRPGWTPGGASSRTRRERSVNVPRMSGKGWRGRLVLVDAEDPR